MQHLIPIFRELLRGGCFQNSNCTEYGNRNPVTRASSRDINAISPDTEIRRCHIGATSADDPSAAAYSSNCRKRTETACPFGWYRKRDNVAPMHYEMGCSRSADFSKYVHL